MGGTVTLYNPTATKMDITVNGGNPFPLAAAAATNQYLPTSPATSPTRTDNGFPAPTQFGYDGNNLLVSPLSGGGQAHQFQVNIPRQLQTGNDLEFYVYYDPDPTKGFWALLWQGGLQDHGTLSS